MHETCLVIWIKGEKSAESAVSVQNTKPFLRLPVNCLLFFDAFFPSYISNRTDISAWKTLKLFRVREFLLD